MSWLKRILQPRPVGQDAVRVFVGNDSPVTSIATSSNGRLAIVGTMGGGSDFADVKSVEVRSEKGGGGDETVPLAHSPFRQWVGGAAELWSVDRGVCLKVFEAHRKPVRAVAMDAKGRIAVSAGDDSTYCVWDIKKKALKRSVDTGGQEVNSMALCREGKRLLAGGSHGYQVFWQIDTDIARPLIPTKEATVYTIRAVAMSADAKVALTAGDEGVVNVWDLDTNVCLHRLYGHKGAIASMALADDANVAASGGEDGRLRIWDLSRAECIRTLQGHSGGITAVALSRDGRTAISAGVSSHKAAVRVWDIVTNSCLLTFRGHRKAVSAVRITPDGRFVLSGSHDGTMQLWPMPLRSMAS